MGLFTRQTDYGPQIAVVVAEVATLRAEIGRLADRIERGSTTQLRADLDNLVGRVEGVAQSMQRQFGRIYASRSEQPAPGVPGGTEGDADPELTNLLEFQRNFSQGGH
jgi:hypothetical protein